MARSSYTSVLPIEINERIKNIDNIYKIANVKLTPVNKSYPLVSSESPRCEIYLPSDSVLNLQNAILEATIKFNQRGNGGATAAGNYVQSVYPPRYALASLIEELNIYINGISVSSTKRYNYIYNWIKDWLDTYDVDIDNGLNEVKDPSVLYQKPTGGSGMAGRVVPRRGYPVSAWNDDAANNDLNARMKGVYHMNLGDSVGFFGEGSSKIINTAILGEVKIELVFTSQVASCMLGNSVPVATHIFANTASVINATLQTAQTKGADDTATTANVNFARQNVEVATKYRLLGDCGVATVGATSNTRAGAVGGAAVVAADANITYEVSDIILHIEALQFKLNDYYNVMTKLVQDGLYKYHFKRYVLQTDTATADRLIDYRLVVNSECLNYVLATFRPNGYDTLSQPVITQLSATAFGHTGTADTSFDVQVARCLPYTFNQSKFFVRNGQRIKRLGWKVDETYFEPRTKQEMYIDNIRHWRNYKPGVETKPHKGLKNIYDFEYCYFTGILSFETKSEDDVKYIYPLRGLNTNGKAVAITCFTEDEPANYTAQAGSAYEGFSDVDLNPAGNAIPTFLVCTTATLQLMGVRNVDLRF